MNHAVLSYALWEIVQKSEKRWQHSRPQIRQYMYTLYKLNLLVPPAELPAYSILRGPRKAPR